MIAEGFVQFRSTSERGELRVHIIGAESGHLMHPRLPRLHDSALLLGVLRCELGLRDVLSEARRRAGGALADPLQTGDTAPLG
jgi:hypothetical protein